MTRTLTVWGYAVLAAVAVVYQVAGLLLRRTATVGEAVSGLKTLPGARPLLFVGWLWLGWHTFVRGTPG